MQLSKLLSFLKHDTVKTKIHFLCKHKLSDFYYTYINFPKISMYLVYTPSKYWKSNKDNLGRFDFLLFQSSYLCTHENTFDRYKVVAVDGVSQYWKYSITSMDSLSHLCSTYLTLQWSEIYEKKWNLGKSGCLP